MPADEKPCLLDRLAEDFKYLATSPSRMDTTSAIITLALAGIGGALYAEDEKIRELVQNHKNPFQDNLAIAGEQIGYPYCLGVAAIWGGPDTWSRTKK